MKTTFALSLTVLALLVTGTASAGSMPVSCSGKQHSFFFEHYKRDVWSPSPVQMQFARATPGGESKAIKVVRRTKRGGYLVLVAKDLVALYFGYRKMESKKHVLVYHRKSGEVLELIACQ